MSIIKFKLTDDHIKLVKHLGWGELTDTNLIRTTDQGSPFGGFDYYEDMGVILYGKPNDFDPFDGNPFQWSNEQKLEMDKLLKELPMALEVILNKQTFEPGLYKTRYHNREWKKVKL